MMKIVIIIIIIITISTTTAKLTTRRRLPKIIREKDPCWPGLAENGTHHELNVLMLNLVGRQVPDILLF